MYADVISWIAIVIAVAVAVALLILHKKGFIESDILDAVSDVLDQLDTIQHLPGAEEAGVVDKIFRYAVIAVNTVEQLVRTGKIMKDNDARQSAALTMVENAAVCDGLDFGEEERQLAIDCIEANVYNLPWNQRKAEINKPPENETEE